MMSGVMKNSQSVAFTPWFKLELQESVVTGFEYSTTVTHQSQSDKFPAASVASYWKQCVPIGNKSPDSYALNPLGAEYRSHQILRSMQRK